MSVTNMQARAMMSGLLAAATLLVNVQADTARSSIENHDQRQCGDASPLFLSLGDAYFDLADIPEAAVKSFADTRKTELISSLTTTTLSDGWGTKVLCVGSADQVRAQRHTVTLQDIEGRQSNHPDVERAISITAYEYHKPSRRLAREMIMIPVRSENMIYLDAQTLQTSSRHRQATLAGSYLRESRIDASISGDTLTIDQSVYVNGTLAQWQTWHLIE